MTTQKKATQKANYGVDICTACGKTPPWLYRVTGEEWRSGCCKAQVRYEPRFITYEVRNGAA